MDNLIVISKKVIIILLICGISSGCKDNRYLQNINVRDFATFVKETNYTTDAEKYGWSFVQLNVYDFKQVEGATWKKPDGINEAQPNMPVTQVSFNDAKEYCKWSNSELPNYEEYWRLAKKDVRKVIQSAPRIAEISEANIIGNTWDITHSINQNGDVRLAGGSYLCNKFTCDGTSPDNVLYVSADTGNSHISFSIIK